MSLYIHDHPYYKIPFSKACKIGDIWTVHQFLEQGINPTYSQNHPLRIAAKNGRDNILYVLLQDPRVDPSDMCDYAFRIACSRGHLEVAILLWNDPRFKNPAAHKNQALKAAACNGHYEIVKWLLADSRVNSRARRDYAFVTAAKNGHMNIVELLQTHNEIKNLYIIEDAIIFAAANNHANVLKWLLEKPIGYTALTYDIISKIVVRAIHKGYIPILDYMFGNICFSSYRITVMSFIHLALHFNEYKYKTYHITRDLDFDCRRLDKSRPRTLWPWWRLDVIDRLFSYPLCYKISGVSGVCFDHIRMIKTRATEICIALFDQELPALLTVAILDELIPNCIRMFFVIVRSHRRRFGSW